MCCNAVSKWLWVVSKVKINKSVPELYILYLTGRPLLLGIVLPAVTKLSKYHSYEAGQLSILVISSAQQEVGYFGLNLDFFQAFKHSWELM